MNYPINKIYGKNMTFMNSARAYLKSANTIT